MPKLPRLVVVHSPAAHETACTVALLAALQRQGYQVQHFRSVAAFTPIDHVTPLTGIASRHLDPWIMDEAMCRRFFAQNAGHADLSLIDGVDDSAGGDGSAWHAIARYLAAPVVAVVPADASHRPPPHVDGVLIDGFSSLDAFHAMRTSLEDRFGVAVLGGLAAGHPASQCSERMRRGRRIPGPLVDELSRNLLQATRIESLMALADSRPFPTLPDDALPRPSRAGPLRVAVAYDDCFHCYFPDTLDALEFHGAELREFSPLSDERLPPDTDLVYLGCGHPEESAQQLSHNECMRAAIRDYVCSGRRVYAEGGGVAYLCQQLDRADGSTYPMVGIFPARARFARPDHAPQRVTLRCERTNWIADRGAALRGYHTGAWQLEGSAELMRCCAAPEQPLAACVMRHHCIGSTVHLNFAAQPRFLDRFFAPHAPSLSL